MSQSRYYRGGDLDNVPDADAEFVFTRLIFEPGYQNQWPGNSPWRDWPESDIFFIKGVKRLTAVDVDDNSHALELGDDRLFEHPWLYALEVGSWLLSEEEAANLREYLLRGGFLVVDDFHGSVQWQGFMRSMELVFPNRPIIDISETDEIMEVFFNVDKSMQIPGILALRAGHTYEHDGYTPHWRGIYDDDGRLMVIINHNMDLGDAWELSNSPYYPESFTALAYRFGVNYVIYAMTH